MQPAGQPRPLAIRASPPRYRSCMAGSPMALARFELQLERRSPWLRHGSVRARHAAAASRHRGPHPLDHRRPGLRRRHGLHHRRHPAEHRGRRAGRHPGPPEGAPAQPGARLRERRRLPEVLVSGRARASSTRSSWSSRARSPTRRSRPKATGPRFGTDQATGQPITTCEWIDRLAPKALGRGGDRHLRHLRRHPRHGGQPDRLHGPGRLPGLGLEVEGRHPDRQRARAARCSRTTSWRRCSTCSTRRPGWRR